MYSYFRSYYDKQFLWLSLRVASVLLCNKNSDSTVFVILTRPVFIVKSTFSFYFPLLSVETYSVQFSSVTQSCPTLCDHMDCSTSGFPVHHQLLELIQTHVHRVNDAIQSSHPLSSPSPPALNLFQHHSFFQWVGSSHQMARVLEFQLQHQSFQWTLRTDRL